MLTVGRDGEIVLDDYTEVLESKKIFIYAEDSKQNSIEVPEGYKILGDKEVTFFE